MTSAANGQVSASANLYVGASTVPMAVTLQYTDRSNWTIGISKGSAGASYAPVNGTTLNINQISGTITNTAGNISHFLTLSGYTIGDATFDLVASFDETGLTASALVSDLEVGGSTLETATITVSTATPEVDITATLDSDAGNFDAEIKASGPLPTRRSPSVERTWQAARRSSTCRPSASPRARTRRRGAAPRSTSMPRARRRSRTTRTRSRTPISRSPARR